MAIVGFALVLWEATIVWSDNKSVTRFFQTKAIPPALWNACDYVLQFNFKIAHIGGSLNTAADFHSRLELKVTEKIRLKIREDIQTTRIELTTSSSDVADEKQLSSHKQTIRTSHMNKHLNEKRNLNKMGSNG